ncbi:MAG: cellulase family glycosylhydrolase [Alphaproteobacteria bacterium]
MTDQPTLLLPPGPYSTSGNQIVNGDGAPVHIRAVNWFGGETTTFVPQGLWIRDWREMMDQMVEQGFNAIRLPFSTEMVLTNPVVSDDFLSGSPDLSGLRSLEIFDLIVGYAEEIGLKILLEHHRSEAGSGASENGLWFTDLYSEDDLIAAWTVLTERYGPSDAILGADLHNEPHGPATWGGGGATDWAAAAERIGNAVLAGAPDWLIVVEGVEVYEGDGYWWGGNLQGVGERPIVLDVADKVVYSPHDYPNSVAPQPWFTDGTDLYDLFRRQWGYIYEDGIAPVLLGEFGSRLEDPLDFPWAEAITDYIGGDFDGDGFIDVPEGDATISYAWWSWNPNSDDTGGILEDDWQTVRTNAIDLLEPLLTDPVTVGGSGAIEGRVFADVNENDLNDGEPGVADMRVELLSGATSRVLDDTRTASDGSYRFDDVAPGAYRVRFFGADGTTFADPGRGDETIDSDVAYTGSGGNGNTDILRVNGQTLSRIDAGRVTIGDDGGPGGDAPARIEGRYFLDANANNRDDDEPGLEGETVALFIAGTQTRVATVLSDATGAYQFNGLEAGDYYVRFFGVPDTEFSDPGRGDEASDSDVAFVGSAGNGNTAAFSLAPGAAVVNLDAGRIVPGLENDPSLNKGDDGTASIAGRYFLDANANDRDDGEAGLEGETVALLIAGTQTTVATTATDADGRYGFEGIEAGDYYLRFFGTDGAIFSDPGRAAPDVDSDVAFMGSGGNGNSFAYSLSEGEDLTDIDAGRILLDPPGSALEVFAEDPAEGPGTADQSLTLTNTGDDEIADWTVVLDLNPGDRDGLTFGPVSGALLSDDGEDVFFEPAPGADPIAPGASIPIVFTVQFDESESLPWGAEDFSLA